MTAGYRCIHCGAGDEELAKAQCKNPKWHAGSEVEPGSCDICRCTEDVPWLCSRCCHVNPCQRVEAA